MRFTVSKIYTKFPSVLLSGRPDQRALGQLPGKSIAGGGGHFEIHNDDEDSDHDNDEEKDDEVEDKEE